MRFPLVGKSAENDLAMLLPRLNLTSRVCSAEARIGRIQRARADGGGWEESESLLCHQVVYS